MMFPAEISWCRQQKCNPSSENQHSLHVLCTESRHAISNVATHQTHSAWTNQLHSAFSDLRLPAVRSQRKLSTAVLVELKVQHTEILDKWWIHSELAVWGESKAKINAHTSRSEFWQYSKGTNHPFDWLHFLQAPFTLFWQRTQRKLCTASSKWACNC